MMDLLVFKEKMKKIYQTYQGYIEPAFKFITAFIVFTALNQAIGFDPRLKKIVVVLLLSVLSAFTPFSVLVLLAALISVGHVYYTSKLMAVLVILILFILYFMFARFTPKQGLVILAVPILFILKIPYAVPILMGMTAAPVSIVSTGCGVVVYFLFQVIKEAAAFTAGASADDTLQIYTYVLNHLVGNKEMLLTLGVFAAVITVTYLMRRRKIDHAFDIAIVAGAVTNMLLFLIGDLKLDHSNQILGMILGTIISAGFVYIIQFFRLTLDYTRVEKVQFEDEDYYYYVKAVPKINVTEPQKNVKKINPQKVTRNTINLKTHLDYDLLPEEDMGESEDFYMEGEEETGQKKQSPKQRT